MNVKIKRLNEKAVIPAYNKETDAGMDLVATSRHFTENYVEYGTSIALEIPNGYVGLLFPRSSVSKHDLLLCNSVGVVDSGYRGEVKLRFKLINVQKGLEPYIYNIGDKIGQLMIVPYPKVVWEVVEELSETERGQDGFGSSGH